MLTLKDLPKLTGPQQVAIVLLSVSDDSAAKVFALMNEDEIRDVSHAMSNLGAISQDVVDKIVEDFNQEMLGNSVFLGNLYTTEKLLEKVLDGDRVRELMEEIKGPQGKNTWEKLSNVNEELLALYLRNEHPQTAALILSKMAPDHAARVLHNFPEDFAFEVITRLMNLGTVKKEILDKIEKILKAEFISSFGKTLKQDSLERMAEIFNNLERNSEMKYMSMLEHSMPEAAQRIKDMMFTFEDLIKFDSRSIQVLLRHIDKTKLAVAMKGASEQLRKMFYDAMSQRAARIVADDIEAMGPVRVRDVDEAQLSIVSVAKELMSRGEIDMFIDGKDQYIS